MKYLYRTLCWSALVALLALVVVPPTASHAQTSRLCFDVPGITNCIEGRFRQFWENNGGLAVFGYPTSAAANRSSAEGTFLTQDFERNRFELHPENAAPYDVLLGRLGDDLLRAQGLDWQTFTRAARREDCRFFAETQHNVCDFAPGVGFRTYWESHGLQDPALNAYGKSLALFGLPLSEPGIETNADGDTVVTQWFERARFEWHPNNPPAFKVLLGRLGSEVARPMPSHALPADAPWIAMPGRIVGAVQSAPTLHLAKGESFPYHIVSPDGSVLVNSQQNTIGEPGFELYKLDARTGTRTRILTTSNSVINPQFAPDSKNLAFATIDGDTWEFRIVDVGTGNTRTVTRGVVSNRVLYPVGWTTGALFVAEAIWGSDAPLSNLQTLDPATGARRTVYSGSFWSANPSTDGSRVALLTGDIGMGSTPDLTILALETANGRSTTVATDIAAAVTRIEWSPDNTRLVYVTFAYESGMAALHVAGADGSTNQRLMFQPLGSVPALHDARWRSNSTLTVVHAGERAINVSNLAANNLRLENLAPQMTLRQRLDQTQNPRLVYMPK